MLIGVAWSKALKLLLNLVGMLALFGAASFAMFPQLSGWLASACLLLFMLFAWRLAAQLCFGWRFGFLLRFGPAGIDGHGLTQLPWNAVLGMDVVERSEAGIRWPELRLLMTRNEPGRRLWALPGLVFRKGDELVLSGPLWNVDAGGLRNAVPDLLCRFAPHADVDWCAGLSRDSTLQRLHLRELERVAERRKAAAMDRLKQAPSSEATVAWSEYVKASNRHEDLMLRQIGTFDADRERRIGALKRTMALAVFGLLPLCLAWLLWSD